MRGRLPTAPSRDTLRPVNADTENTVPGQPDPGGTRLQAESHRQALDWSLVLLSQGIESLIAPAADESGAWHLVIESTQHAAAMEAIRLYEIENRGWPWQTQLLRPGLVFDWGVLAWVALLGMFFVLDTQVGLESRGIMDSRAVAAGEWWRLSTAAWLHADVGHLATNCAIGVILLGLAMGLFGTGAGFLTACLAGVGGNLAALLLAQGPHLSRGASGMVMGALGLLATYGLKTAVRTSVRNRIVLAGLLAGVMLFVLLGLSPGTDVLAHLGGFITGAVAGVFMRRLHAHNKTADFVCGLAGALICGVSWWFALRR